MREPAGGRSIKPGMGKWSCSVAVGCSGEAELRSVTGRFRSGVKQKSWTESEPTLPGVLQEKKTKGRGEKENG